MRTISREVPRIAENQLLSALPDKEYQRLLPELRPVHLGYDQVIYECGEPINYVYFPQSAVVSMLSVLEDGATVEVAMIGNPGMVGIAAILGAQYAPNWTVTQVAGDALKMRTRVLVELFRESEPLAALLARFYRALVMQISQRAVCNCRHSVTQRLCTWLLMVHDRYGQSELPLTQDLISRRLGSRRATITVAANQLESLDIIRSHRGHINILDRAGLVEFACECYAAITREVASVTGI